MPLFPIPAEEALRRLHEFDTVIDARSEGEYAEDHLPGALNWPTLNNEQRKLVGTEYKQINAFEAKKRGAALAARNIAAHIEREVMDKPKDWKPLTYCWRGGKRSGSLSLILSEIGFRVTIVEGGYKAFRNALLQALAAAGAQVLDLEALANHRSSVLGAIPGLEQPTQKAFDTRVWDALRRFDPQRPVYVESESKKVGNVAVAPALIEAMRAAPCLNLVLPDEERVALLLEDYAHYVRDDTAFCERLDALVELRGKKVVEEWKALVHGGRTPEVVRDLLLSHYDPGYRQSMARNFSQFAQAPELLPRDRSAAAMQALAAQMLQK
jgi:tRNA 2-selenouridine synthase